MAAELLVDAAEQEPPDRERQAARDAPEPIDRRGAAALGDLALDRAPEQVEHLGHDDHARDPMVAQGVEDDPWVPAPDIEHVGADIERVVQRRPPVRAGARGGAARRSGAPSAARCGGTTRSMPRRCRVPARTPLGVPVVPLVNTSSKSSSAVGRFQAAWRASQSAGKTGSSSAGSAVSASTVVVGKSARPASRGSGASRPVPRTR